LIENTHLASVSTNFDIYLSPCFSLLLLVGFNFAKYAGHETFYNENATNPCEQINKSTKSALNPPRNPEILTTNQNLDNFQKPKMIFKKNPHTSKNAQARVEAEQFTG